MLGRKSFLQDDLKNYQIVMKKNGLLRILGPNERPLKIQKRLLEQAGYTEDDHLEEIGREDHGYLCRFTFMMSRMGGYSLVCRSTSPRKFFGRERLGIYAEVANRYLFTFIGPRSWSR